MDPILAAQAEDFLCSVFYSPLASTATAGYSGSGTAPGLAKQ